jgi:hypothetical protein
VTTIAQAREPEELPEEDQPAASEVKEALSKILDSHPFRTSRQCQDLLRYVVERTLDGADVSLRERIIGVEVFGRQPTYDTSEDPVVRVRAADVRKRLAQYYQSLESGSPVLQIELLPGSYRAHFRNGRPAPGLEFPAAAPRVEIEPPPAEIPPPTEVVGPARLLPSWRRHSWLRLRSWRSRVFAGVLGLVIVVGFYYGIQYASTSPQERFWAPAFSAKQPVLLYLGSNAAYIFTAEYLARYRETHGLPNHGPEFFVDLAPDDSVHFGDLHPVRDTFVTVGDLAATVQLTTAITAWKKPFVLRSGRDINFADLRNRPSVMIGAFNNPWTLELTKDLPFSLQDGTRIQDRDHPERVWNVTSPEFNSASDDFSLISRMLVSKTGAPLITAAGIGQYGTQAAAEFLGSPERMRDLLKSAPRGWEYKNMQAVLHVKVVGFTPVAVEVVATSYW